jgi:hypothetical protein
MRPTFDAIAWWEWRRIPFNVMVVISGAASFAAILLVGARLVNPGEDVVEPLAVIFGGVAYLIGANALYTLGWVTELLWSGGDTRRTEPLRAGIYRKGVIFSVALTLLPGILVPLLWWMFGFQHQ